MWRSNLVYHLVCRFMTAFDHMTPGGHQGEGFGSVWACFSARNYVTWRTICWPSGIIPRETKFQAENPTCITMTGEQYEDVYRETLRCLSEQYSVGDPSLDASGNRVCKIEGVPMNDDEVLERWWGAEIRDDIRRQYPSK